MCARFTLRKPPWPLAKTLGSTSVARTLRSRFNIAPTQPIVAVLNEVDSAVTESRASAETVLGASDAVESAARQLRENVEGFLRRVAV